MRSRSLTLTGFPSASLASLRLRSVKRQATCPRQAFAAANALQLGEKEL